MINYDRYPRYSARCEGRDIVRAGLAPYMESVGLIMPPPAHVPMPASEAPAVRADAVRSIQLSVRATGDAYRKIAMVAASAARNIAAAFAIDRSHFTTTD